MPSVTVKKLWLPLLYSEPACNLQLASDAPPPKPGKTCFRPGLISQLELSKMCARLKAIRAVGVILAGRTEYSRTIFRHARRNSAAWAVNRKCNATLLILTRTASTIPDKDG